VRRLEERPMLEQRVVIAVEVRRFKCMSANCSLRTFAENLHALASRHQRRTRSQARALHALGHALDGEAAARLANALSLRTSADTVLRELRRASERSGSSASMTGRLPAVTNTERSSSIWSDVSRSKCLPAGKQLQ